MYETTNCTKVECTKVEDCLYFATNSKLFAHVVINNVITSSYYPECCYSSFSIKRPEKSWHKKKKKRIAIISGMNLYSSVRLLGQNWFRIFAAGISDCMP